MGPSNITAEEAEAILNINTYLFRWAFQSRPRTGVTQEDRGQEDRNTLSLSQEDGGQEDGDD